MLLSWGTLYPNGTSKLASIRFSSPVKITSLRIFPNSCHLFSSNPEAFGQTEPKAFTLTVFLNAQALPSANETTKARSTNNLITTNLHYPGGMREFSLNLGHDYATRLLILQGDFTSVTIAVYGDLAVEMSADELMTGEHVTPSISVGEVSLPTILDPINLSDPTLLPMKLLELTPNPPPLPLLVRLQFGLKLQDQIIRTDDIRFAEWEDLLESDVTGLEWLERAATMLNLPVAETVAPEILNRLSSRIIDSLVEKTNDSLFIFAGLIRRVSTQPEIVVDSFLVDLDFSDIFESHLLDKHIIERLHDAAAHPSIARCLGSPSMMSNLDSFLTLYTTNLPAKQATIALQDRVRGWEEFEKSIQGGSADIPLLMHWIRKLTSEDITCGIFLNYLISDTFSATRREYFLHIDRLHFIPSWSSASLVTFPEFLAFLKAFIGISSTLAVFSWAVDLGAHECVEKFLSIARLWQEVPAYEKIFNHVFVLPRILYRLEDVLRQPSDPPNISIQYGEQILSHLLDNVETMACPDLTRLVDGISDQGFLSSARRSEMSRIVFITEHGLEEAIRTVFDFSAGNSINILHAALLVIEKAFEDPDNGVWNLIHTSWEQDFYGLGYQLIDLLGHFIALMRGQFLLEPPPPLHATILTQLVHSSHSILRILTHLFPTQIQPSRLVHTLVDNILNLFILTDAIDSIYPFGNPVRHAARLTRPTCAETLSTLCTVKPEICSGSSIGVLVFRTLVQNALRPENDDPVIRVEQVFWLLDLVLPLSISDTVSNNSQEQYWIKEVIPNILPELNRFFRALTTDNQLQLAGRLIDLDREEIGLGQWFIDQELNFFGRILEQPETSWASETNAVITLQIIKKSLRFLTGFLKLFPIGKYPGIYQETETLLKLYQAMDNPKMTAPLLLPYTVDLALALIPDMNLLAVDATATLVTLERSDMKQDTLIRSLGRSLTGLATSRHELPGFGKDVTLIFEWLQKLGSSDPVPVYFSEQIFDRLSAYIEWSEMDHRQPDDFRINFIFNNETDSEPDVSSSKIPPLSFQDVKKSLGNQPLTPSTPRLNGESIFKMTTTSPITTLFNSVKTTLLTKTYQQNEFRQLSARQNTSRRPSVHVDEFEQEKALSGSEQVPPEYGQLLPPLKFE
ncbi:hypothetical protein Clacol_001478 [Clathrus columnatus]|uniref:Virilizer N-terminal domain-containing protein n=1 Tax=Clathrus columnatus TaxID=1419009 RepID=A0AAV5A1B7_9AGAM|nr:hypothetical protein Clacol_001478 [Clathrus columnatus]